MFVIPVTSQQMAGAIASYRAYVTDELILESSQVQLLRAAIADGQLAAARAAWLTAHLTWHRIGGAYDAFGDLGLSIDGTADRLQAGVDSPQFTGFHKVEMDLWQNDDLTAAAGDTGTLLTDVNELARQFPGESIPATELPLRTHEILEDALRDELSGDDDYGSGTDMASVEADVDGTRELLALLAPVLAPRAPDLEATVGHRTGHAGRGPGGDPGERAVGGGHRRAAGATGAGRRGHRRRPRNPGPRPRAPPGRGVDDVTIDRRKFLLRSGLGAVGASAALSASAEADAVTPSAPVADAKSDATLGPVPFEGRHQAGILTPAPPAAAFLALDVIAEDRSTLTDLLRTITGAGPVPHGRRGPAGPGNAEPPVGQRHTRARRPPRRPDGHPGGVDDPLRRPLRAGDAEAHPSHHHAGLPQRRPERRSSWGAT